MTETDPLELVAGRRVDSGLALQALDALQQEGFEIDVARANEDCRVWVVGPGDRR